MFGWRREGCYITASPDLNTSYGGEIKEVQSYPLDCGRATRRSK